MIRCAWTRMAMGARGATLAGSLTLLLSALPLSAAETSQSALTGIWGGLRKSLDDRGVDLGFTYIGETMGVLAGGLRRGWIYEGRLEGDLDLDLSRLLQWDGAQIHASAYQLHHAKGRPAADYGGSLADPSNIEARASLRLFTLWLEQSFFEDKISVRLGQIAADDEFFIAPTAAGLMNSSFGWATILAANQVQGGPVFPLAVPGTRLAVTLTEGISARVAVFYGDPAGHGCAGDPQGCNRSGTKFSMSGEPLWMAEMEYDTETAFGLPGTVILGGWLGHSRGDFRDQRRGVDAGGDIVPLASPAAASPLGHSQDWGVYGLVDQTVWRKGERSVNVFLRAGYAPEDRNIVSFYVDGGIGMKGPLHGRENDILTFGMAHSSISGDAAQVDRALNARSGADGPVRSGETVVELSYTAQITPWWSLQPDFQYIIQPGGNVPRADDPARAVGDAVIAGLRFTLTL